MASLAPLEFSPETTYLNTASFGLPASRTLATLRGLTDEWARGRAAPSAADERVDALRTACARLLSGATADDVALGSSVSALVAPVAAALPSGAEVLLAEGEFSSLSMPFVHRKDLRPRFVPLEDLAREVNERTALVAVSAIQSCDGRAAELGLLRAAAHAHGAELLVDATQAAGWLPLDFHDADYWVGATFKWLIGSRSVAYFALCPDSARTLRPVSPGWYAARDRWAEMYRPVALPDSARRFDTSPDWFGVAAALSGLELVEELGVDKIHAHDVGLADEFRAGLTARGLSFVAGRSPIVSIPGAAQALPRLEQADVVLSARDGGLRFAFHLYNSEDDVARALEVLGEAD